MDEGLGKVVVEGGREHDEEVKELSSKINIVDGKKICLHTCIYL